MARITKRFLQSKGACRDQIAIFAAEWPNGSEISLASLTRAAELGLDIGWLAANTLEAPADAAYEAARAPAYAAYKAAIAPAYAAYKAAIATAYWTAFQSQEQPASV